jgi:hypothetical protein
MCQAHSWIYCRSWATVALRVLYGRIQQRTDAMPADCASQRCFGGEDAAHGVDGCLCLSGGPLRTQLRTLRGLGKGTRVGDRSPQPFTGALAM